ncbi:hypothetical protein Asp14428_79520 [Actinoplanes sp. NBRC 14428]|nr:hypothetical protein Asp14428_79520 [Actinoplanes sp. NBRC 14428]
MIVAVHAAAGAAGAGDAGGVVRTGILPVWWSKPQSSQKRPVPGCGAPQCGQEPAVGAAAASAGVDSPGAGAAPVGGDSDGAGAAPVGGGRAAPAIFAPHVSQKSSVVEA